MKLTRPTLLIMALFSAKSSAQTNMLQNPSFEKAPIQKTISNNPQEKLFNNHHYNQMTEVSDWGLPAAKDKRDYSFALVKLPMWNHKGTGVSGAHGSQALWILNDKYKAHQIVHRTLKKGHSYNFTISAASVGDEPGSILMRLETPVSILAERVIPFSGKSLKLQDYNLIYQAKGNEPKDFIVSFGVKEQSNNVFVFDNARLTEHPPGKVVKPLGKTPSRPIARTTSPQAIQPTAKALLSYGGISIIVTQE
jgi:hypothetical protein